MLTVVDFILLIICLFFVLRGLFRGVVMEFFSILALIAGFLASLHYYPLAAGLFESIFPAGASRNAGGLIAVFIVVWLLIKILSWILNRSMGEAESKSLNRIGGGALALVKAVLFLAFIVFSGRKRLAGQQDYRRQPLNRNQLKCYWYARKRRTVPRPSGP